MIRALIHGKGLFNWHNIGRVRASRWSSSAVKILCLALLHLTVPPLLCEPILFTTLDQTVVDLMPTTEPDTTKWSSVVLMKHAESVFCTKVQQVIFPIMPLDCSSQVLFGLPALVVTLVWGSSVDPAPTPCYSHYSFLARLFLFYVFNSSGFFYILLLNIFQRSSSFVWHSLLRQRCLAWHFVVWRFKCLALLCWHRFAFDCPRATVALQIDWQNNYGLDLSNRRKSGIEWVAEHKEHVYLFFSFFF